jgi:sugar phosphate isomerase/epimerase
MRKLIFVLFVFACGIGQAERKFFALDNGLVDIKSADEQAALLKELGYAGICTRPEKCTDEFLAAYDKHGIDISATYVVLPAGIGKTELPVNIVNHFKKLKGRGTIVWFSLTNAKSPIEPAVELTRNVCDEAAKNGLSVVFYPHFGCLTARIAICEKIVNLAARKNLGTSFTLCHFLAQNDHKKSESTIKSMAPHLKLVQINGANELPQPKADWEQLIQPLGEGSLDVGRVIRTLDEIGYDGPVGLQCYKVPGTARSKLEASMQLWKKYNKALHK